MKAARIHEYRKPLVLEDVPTPVPGPGEVLVQVHGAGFCHSDIHVMDGEIPVLPRMPMILGHENAGVVAATGSGVKQVSEGDPVAVFGGWGCGWCDYCVTGHEQLCGSPEWAGLSGRDGGYAEYLLVPQERYLVKLNTLKPALAAPLTDAALTPYRAIKKALPVLEPDRYALAIGIGGLGQYGLKLLRVLAGCPVIAIDRSEKRLQTAIELGAVHALNFKDPKLAEKIRDITGGHGVSASFDFVGTDETLDLAIGATRSLGKVAQIGLAGGSARMKVLERNRFEVQFEATLWGTIKELREVIALVESGRLSMIATEVAPLDQINEVYRRLKHGDIVGRAVISPAA
jgi:propanol-preferring alcohol dehydrogenase